MTAVFAGWWVGFAGFSAPVYVRFAVLVWLAVWVYLLALVYGVYVGRWWFWVGCLCVVSLFWIGLLL